MISYHYCACGERIRRGVRQCSACEIAERANKRIDTLESRLAELEREKDEARARIRELEMVLDEARPYVGSPCSIPGCGEHRCDLSRQLRALITGAGEWEK